MLSMLVTPSLVRCAKIVRAGVCMCVIFHRSFDARSQTLEGNTTASFLLTTDTDIGDLMIVKLRWEKDAYISWSDWWGSSKFHIRQLRVKSGETQSK